MGGVTGNSTCPAISAGSSFAAIKHFITTLTLRTEVKKKYASDSHEHLDTGNTHSVYCMCHYVHIGTCISSATLAAVAVGELNAVVGPPGVTGV